MSQPPPSSKEDLRGQLSEIQKKLFGSKKGSINPISDEKHPLRSQAGINASPAQAARRNVAPSGQARMSGGVGSSSTSKVIPQPRQQLRPESKGQDMNFVVGLSENLLSECRRLSAENQKLKSKLKSQADEISDFKTHVNTLSKSKSSAADAEIELKDRNWELETKLSMLKEEMDTLKSANDRLVKTHNETTLRVSALQRDNEELNLKTVAIASKLRLANDAYNQELSDLRDRIDTLNDENDNLLLQISLKNPGSMLLEELLKDQEHHKLLVPEIPDQEVPMDLNQIIDELSNVPVLLSKSDPSNTQLEIETLRANIAHSNKTINRLRASLVKLKNAPTLSTHNTPKSSKKLKLKEFQPPLSARSAFKSPANRNSKFIVLNDLEEDTSSPRSEWGNNGEWENFTGGLLPNTPSKPARVTRDASLASSDVDTDFTQNRVVLHDSDSLELEFEAPENESSNRILSQELSKALGSVSEDQVQQFAKDNGLVLLSLAEYAKLEHNNIEEITSDRLIAILKNKGSVLLSQEEYDELLDEQEMKKKLEAKGLVTIPLDELLHLKDVETKYSQPDFEYLNENLQGAGFETVSKDRLKSLENSQIMVESPTETFIRSKAKTLGLEIVQGDELSRLRRLELDYSRPSKDYLQVRANEMGLIVSSLDMYDEMKKKAQEPELGHIQEMAKRFDFTIVPDDEYQLLVSPGLEQLKKHASREDHVLTSKAELDRTKQLLESPPIEYLQEKASTLDSKIITLDELEKLQNPDVETLRLKAKSYEHELVENDQLSLLKQLAYHPTVEHITLVTEGLAIVPLEEFSELERLAKNPSIDQLNSHLARQNMLMIDTNDHKSLLSRANEPNLDHLRLKAENLGYELISKLELTDLHHQIECPSTEYLLSKAAVNSKVVIPEDEFITFKRITQLSAEEYLKEKTVLEDLVIMEKQERDNLIRSIEEPSIDYINEKAASLGLTVIPTAEFEKPNWHYLEEKAAIYELCIVENEDFKELEMFVENPPLNFIIEKAANLQQLVLATSEYEALTRSANNPSAEELKEKAIALDLVLLSSTEHASLMQEANTPTLDQLLAKCEELNHTIVENSVYTDLIRKIEDPLVSELELAAQKLNSKLITEDSYAELVKKAEEPSEVKILESAPKFELAAIPQAELSHLKELAEDSSFEKFKNLAQLHNHAVITQVAYDELKRKVESPSREELTDLASKNNYVVAEQLYYDTLVSTFDSPDIMHLSEKAKNHGHVVLPDSELSALKAVVENPDLDWVRSHASNHQQHILPHSEYETLLKLAHEPEISHVQEKAGVLGHTLVKNEDLLSLSALANNPSVDRLRELSTEKNHVLVTDEEYKSLLVPDLPKLRELCSEKAYTCISQSELENLEKLSTEFPLERLSELASEQNHTIVSVDHLKDLESPSLVRIQEMAAKFDNLAVPRQEFEELQQLANNPSIDRLRKLAAALSFTVVANSVYAALMEPSLEAIEISAQRHGASVVGTGELANLRTLVSTPPMAHVEKLAAPLGLALISVASLASLKKTASDPSVSEMEKCAKNKGFELVPAAELSKLRLISESPDLGFLEKAAASHLSVVVSKDQYNELQVLANSPQISHIQKKASDLNYIAISKEEYSTLKKLAHEPEIDHLKEHAEGMNMKFISVDEFSELKKRSENPEKEFLISSLLAHGYVLVPSEEFEKHLEDKEKAKHMKLIPNEQYDLWKSSFENPSLDFLQEKAKSIDYVAVPKEKYGDLLKRDYNPPKEHLVAKAAVLGLSLIEVSELEKLTNLAHKDANPTREDLVHKADSLALVLLEKEELTSLKDSLDSPSLEYLTDKASNLNYTVMAVEEVLKLQKALEEPSIDYLISKAQIQSYLVVPEETLATMKESLDQPSLQFLKEKAILSGHLLIGQKEYDSFKEVESSYNEPQLEYLSSKAQAQEHELVQNSRLAELLVFEKDYKNPSLDYLAQKASAQEYCLEMKPRHLELVEIKQQHQNPSLEYLTEKAKEQNQAVVPEEQLNHLEEVSALYDAPTLEYLQNKAATHNHVLIESSEKDRYESIEKQLNEPSIVYLEEKALTHSKVLISDERSKELLEVERQFKEPSEEYLAAEAGKKKSQILSNEHVSQLMDPSLDVLKLHLLKSNHIAITNDQHAELVEKAASFDSPSLETLALRALILESRVVLSARLSSLEETEKAYESPLNDYLRDKSVAMGLSLVPAAEYEELKSVQGDFAEPSLDYLTEKAEAKSHVLIPEEKYDELKNIQDQYNNPSEEYLHGKAAIFGSTIVAAGLLKELTDIRSSYDAPTFEYLSKHANLTNHSIVEAGTLNELQNHKSKSLEQLASEKESRVISNAEFEELSAAAVQTLEDKALKAKMALLPITEFSVMSDRLKQFDDLSNQLESPTPEFLGEIAKKMDSVVLERTAFEALKNPTFEKLLEWSNERNYCLIQKDELLDLKNSVSEPLDDKALRGGFKLIAIPDYEVMLTQLNTPSLEILRDKARGYNMELLDAQELEDMRKNVALSLEERATLDGLVVVSVAEFNDMFQKTHEPTLADLKAGAKMHDHALIETGQLKLLQDDANLTLVDRVAGTEMALIDQEELNLLKTQREQLAVTEQQAQSLLNEKEELLEKIRLIEEEHENIDYLIPVLQQQAALAGHSLITNEELLALKDEALLSQHIESTDVQVERALSKPEALPFVKTHLEALGYSVMLNEEMPIAVNAENIKSMAEQHGLVVVDEQEYKRLVSSSLPTSETLLVLAAGLSMAVLPIGEVLKLKQSVAERDSTIHELKKQNQAPEKEELVQKLRNLDMVVLSKEEYQEFQESRPTQKTVLTEDDIKESAQELGLTVVPDSEYYSMKRALAVTEDQSAFRDLAKKWNMLCIPETALVATESDKTPDLALVKVVPTPYFDRLTHSESMNIETISDDLFRTYAEKKGFFDANSPVLERVASIGADTIESNFTEMHTARSAPSVHSGKSQASIAHSITALSIATNLSFTDKSMIPAITQVVIGEYLFKYYRKLGPFSLISSSRHERYFWVHPYSLTLYWSSSNPVLTNPSEVRTKAMAIIRVEGVEDTNPLPPGLHYKSIIVHSQTGSVKITCPTRQRHNIWLNALRYLVNRNSNEGILLKQGTAAQSIRLPELDHNSGDNESIFDGNIDVEPSTRHAFPRSSTMPRVASVGHFDTPKRK